jgi:tight adherence protein B
MTLVLTVTIFIAVLCIVEGFLGNWSFDESKKVREKLRVFSDDMQDVTGGEIVRRRTTLSTMPWLNDLFSRMNAMQRLDTMLRQANIAQPVSIVVLASVVLTSAGFCFGVIATGSRGLSFLLACVVGSAPILHIYLKRKRRMQRFERQLPDALNLIARSLKAGHAFSTGIHVVAQEFEDPVGTEFQRAERQIRLGASVEVALRSLTERVNCPDVRFFAVAVAIQRETGGNLAEIIENISRLIKERFRLKGRVSALCAEGKFSALVLVVMPFAIAFILSLVSPQYVGVLVHDPLGKPLICLALFMIGIGMFAVNKMVNVKI